MAKWIITWNCGYGPMADVIEAESQEDADEAAYDAWREDAENNADYRAQPYDEDEAEALGAE